MKLNLNSYKFRLASFLVIVSVLGIFFVFKKSNLNSVFAQSGQFYKSVLVDQTGWNTESSGTVESVVKTSGGWLCTAGGEVASTHYARLKYKIPENAGLVLTQFYVKAVIVLPANFYTQQQAGFRILNTDNFTSTLNGQSVGASSADELRTAIYFNSDHTLRINTGYENHQSKELWRSTGQIPVGEHTFELFGNVAEIAPWYFKIDGVTVASGVEKLSTDDLPLSDRVITRIVAGIDGAADQDTKPLSVLVKSVEIADYDVSLGLSNLLGDINENGTVNIDDFMLFMTDFGKSNVKADINLNGKADIFDFNILIRNYGKTI